MSARTISEAWILMWASTYLFCAFLKPDLFEGVAPLHGALMMLTIGALLIAGLVLTRRRKPIGRLVLFIMGIFESMGGVASWTGIIGWNVPFADKAAFNVSMAFADILAAVFLLHRALETADSSSS